MRLPWELPAVVRQLQEVLSAPGATRPMRLPLTAALLAELRAASEATGLPAATLLLACLSRAARRQRRRAATAPSAARPRKRRAAARSDGEASVTVGDK